MDAALGAAVFAGAVAIGATVVIERFGGRLGGLLATLPSTIVPFSFGVLWSDPSALDVALGVVPAGMVINAVFLLCWRVVPPRLPDGSVYVRLLVMSTISLTVWAAGAYAWTVAWHALRHYASPLAIGGAGLVVLIALGVMGSWQLPSAPKASKNVSVVVLLSRGLLAAAAIAIGVSLSSAGHPVASGMASVFPAIFLTTMVALWLSQGEAVPAGAVGPMMLGSSAVGWYAVLAAILMPTYGGIGALVAWVGSILLGSLPSWLWLRSRAESVDR